MTHRPAASFAVLSNTGFKRSVAMGCVTEFEAVLARTLGAPIVSGPQEVPPGADVFCICLSSGDVERRRRELARLKSSGSRVVLYVFDAWMLPELLLQPKRGLAARLKPAPAPGEVCDLLCLPFAPAIEMLAPLQSDIRLLHLPLAVDTTLVRGLSDDRPLDVFAYGRQPPEALAALEAAKAPAGTPRFVYRTDHTKVAQVNDIARHRAMFWGIAERSRFALAYDTRSAPIRSGPSFSFVGQRWFESLAAGCIVVGHRPETPEFETLFDWPTPVIDAPEDHRDLPALLDTLDADTSRMDEMRARNVAAMRDRHDWRHRIDRMIDALEGRT